MIRSSMPFSLLACVTALSTVAGAADTTRRDVLIYSDRTPGTYGLEYRFAEAMAVDSTVTVTTDPNVLVPRLGSEDFAWVVVIMKQPSAPPDFDAALRAYAQRGGRVQFAIWKDSGTTVPAGSELLAPTAFAVWFGGSTTVAYSPIRVDSAGMPLDPETKPGYVWPNFRGVVGQDFVYSGATWNTQTAPGVAVAILADPCDCEKLGKDLETRAMAEFGYDLAVCSLLHPIGSADYATCASKAAERLMRQYSDIADRVKLCKQVCNQDNVPPNFPTIP